VSDTPPAALVERAATTFTRTDGDIRAVVRTIVTSPEFFAAAAYRSKVKSPFELVASALRALGADADPTPRTAQVVARLGQPIYGRQTPDGWPETGDGWISAGAILSRIEFGLALAGGALPGVSLAGWPEARELAAASRERQVDAVGRALLGDAISGDTRRILLDGENPLLARAGDRPAMAAADSLDEPDADDPAAGMRPAPGLARLTRAGVPAGGLAIRDPLRLPPERRPTGLAQIVGLALGSPEFQRR
jgi:hypothetical protein